jgi:hypothetical protein
LKPPTWRGLPRRATAGVEFFTAVVTAAVVLAGVFHHFFDTGEGQRSYPGEGRRIVAFRQLANRICEENTGNMNRALRDAESRPQLLSYMQRATGWDTHDLTAITPPPTMIADFLEEVALRRHTGADLGQLQSAAKSQNVAAEAQITADLKSTEAASAELSGTLGLPNCTRILPPAGRYAKFHRRPRLGNSGNPSRPPPSIG